MAKIILMTQKDGIYPSGEVFHSSYKNTLIEAPEITTTNLEIALKKVLRSHRVKTIGLTEKQLHLWLLNKHPKYNGTKYLRIAEIDKPQTSYKWLIKHIK